MTKLKYLSIKLPLIATVFLACLVNLSCSDDLFDKQPLDAVSDATFWKSEKDAELALIGCYHTGGWWKGEDFWTPRSLVYLDLMGGNGSEKEHIPDRVTDGTLTSSYWVIENYWSNSYEKIAACNNFLDHMNSFEMEDEYLRSMMVAEVKTLRAYEYFNLGLYFGDVPLITSVLTIEEANSLSRTPKADVWSFVEEELKEASSDLPEKRAESEHGRITSAAALAILGRLQLAQKDWDSAVDTYGKIIAFESYSIEPKYRELFWASNEINDEFILVSKYKEDDFGHVMPQYLYPEMWGGWHQFSPYNELVKEFECIDGLSIEQSPLYDPNNPYDNRDPRLYHTIMISDRTVFKGKTFVSRPDSDSPDRITRYDWSGYCINKFMDEEFDGNLMNYGGDFPIIRYAEVLLSYLEANLEAGNPISQMLLDQTINLVRGREDVGMPPVTTTNPDELREIIRRERRVEFAFEGLRYFDILRWDIAENELNRQFTGMKLTNNPENYDEFPVDEDGYLLYQKRNFKTGVNELWPIPQSEIDINENLKQNPGY